MDVKVGDEVMLLEPSFGRIRDTPRRAARAVVTKVARKYFTAKLVNGNGSSEYSLEDGVERGDRNWPQYLGKAMLPAEYAHQNRMGVLARRMREDHQLSWNYQGTLTESKWTVEQVEELVGLLDRVKSDADAEKRRNA